ncbi:thymidylate synthase [Micromonospora sp. WMMD714]|uniref:thymidylate synthase n=1 Tax=Micromonospora sp. WMMD714 TaxID=3016097 RepID=UPI00249A675B|nr:thymidylate synthase [Micromonospora sp. WMMD714]WFE65533.1 thymidylate synthase [Micromonospora sp. WMMD714]
MEIEASTVAAGWHEVIALFARQPPTRIATRHGVSFDIPGLTVWLRNPADLTPPQGYLYPELIKDYRDRIFGDQREASLLYQRMRRWADGDGPPVDQFAQAVELLRRDEHSRSAVFSLWRPEEDLGGRFPVSPVGGALRIVGDDLVLFLTARSVDVWVGLVPELLTFAQLAADAALELGLTGSRLCHHSWSAHLYEVDYLTYLAGPT